MESPNSICLTNKLHKATAHIILFVLTLKPYVVILTFLFCAVFFSLIV